MSFTETTFNSNYVIFDTSGGPEHKTQVERYDSGGAVRSPLRDVALGSWDIGGRVVTKSELDEIIRVRRAVKGQAYGFRWKDWGDYRVSRPESIMGQISGLLYQMYKAYIFGTLVEYRPILKPVVGKTIVWKNSVNITGACSIDTTKGQILLSSFTSGDILKFETEFDCPVRFSTDKITYSFEARDPVTEEMLFDLQSMPIEELDELEILN